MKTTLTGNGYSSLLSLLMVLLLFSSCIDTKKVVYFNSISDTSISSLVTNLESVIQKGDILSIQLSSLSPEATTVFNAPNSDSRPTSINGYLVDGDGNIQFPVLGNIPVAGLTKKKLTEDLSKSLTEKKLLVGPIVTIRFLNYRVTVLGEVANPSSISVANEKISLLEAIGLAGDLTIYAKRDNVLLIREENGVKLIRRINLSSKAIFTSPYYYLKSNDVVYVEPNKAKVASISTSRNWLPVVFSALSFAIIIVDRVIQ